MGLCELLTVIFVVCKILGIGVISGWSWWLVLAPEIVAVCFYLIMFVGAIWFATK